MIKEERILEIKKFIEEDCNDWFKLRVEHIEKIGKNTYATVIDEEEYRYKITLDVLRHAKYRNLQLHKFFRNNKYTKYNIENYIRINKKDFSLKSTKVVNATDFLIWNCPIHGDFKLAWNTVKNGQGCPTCGKLQAGINRRNSIEYVRQKFEEADLTLMTDIYENNEQLLPYICNKHKDTGIQYMSFGNLISNKGCPICGRERTALLQTKSHEQFVKEMYEVFGDKYEVIGQYKGCKEHIEIFCNNCNESFPAAPNHLLEGHGCPNCNISRGEEKIKLILSNNKKNFVQQYKFDNCRNKRQLPFDFAIFNDNDKGLFCLIEYQGIQHYKPVETFGGLDQFNRQQFVDNIKRQFCIDNNIKLIEIPYTQYKNIEKILHKNNIINISGGENNNGRN